MENCGRFVVFNNIFFLRKQPALRDMLRHFHDLFKQQTTLSTGLPAK